MSTKIEQWVQNNLAPNFRALRLPGVGMMFSIIKPDADMYTLEFVLDANISRFNEKVVHYTKILDDRLHAYGGSIKKYSDMVPTIMSDNLSPLQQELVRSRILKVVDMLNMLLRSPEVQKACFSDFDMMRTDIANSIGSSIVLCDLLAAAYNPHWTTVVSGNKVSLKLVAFKPRLCDKFEWVYFDNSTKRAPFGAVQNQISAHLLRILKESYPDILQHIVNIGVEFQGRPICPETMSAIEDAVNSYWKDHIPYEVRFVSDLAVEAVLILPRWSDIVNGGEGVVY